MQKKKHSTNRIFNYCCRKTEMDAIEIGPVPCDEECAQVGDENYLSRARRECRAFMNQILRYYPAPECARIFIKSNRHDFGSYLEVAVSGPSIWIEKIEEDSLGVLANWDDMARQELGIKY